MKKPEDFSLANILGPSAAPPLDEISDSSYRTTPLDAAWRVITNDPLGLIKGELRRNVMNGKLFLNDQHIPESEFNILVSRIRLESERRLIIGSNEKTGKSIKLQLKKTDVEEAIFMKAYEKKFHPIQDYLNSLKWDGTSRIAKLIKILNCEDSNLNKVILKKWLISAVARGLRPGIKCDTMLILVGDQGVKKSGFFKNLAGEDLFTDTPMAIGDKDSYMAMSNHWIVEWAELESMRGKEVTQLKAFLSSSTDNYRRPYARDVETVPRCSVVVGTTNTSEFLTDDTGNRRYWIIKCGRIDQQGVVALRDQVWAEAVTLYLAGEKHYFDLDDEEFKEVSARQQEHVVHDEWIEPVAECLKSKTRVRIYDVLVDGLGLGVDKVNSWNCRRVATILRGLGWKQAPQNAAKERWWIKTGDLTTLTTSSLRTAINEGKIFPINTQS